MSWSDVRVLKKHILLAEGCVGLQEGSDKCVITGRGLYDYIRIHHLSAFNEQIFEPIA